ncbi:hypothetical protein [Geothrix campi]|uniref:hypothetical protein n=1 Tax=Geothrix campi TaxID=2966450 RepID=UPI002148772C|nr:hypothetical protein [Geothrix sp. SG10]
MYSGKFLGALSFSIVMFHCSEPTTSLSRTQPTPSPNASSVIIKPQSLLLFFRETYRHPNDEFTSNPLSRLNASAIGTAHVKLLITDDGRIKQRDVVESNGHMWNLIKSSIYKIEFDWKDINPSGSWVVELYFSSKSLDLNTDPQQAHAKRTGKTDGEITVTILSATPATTTANSFSSHS